MGDNKELTFAGVLKKLMKERGLTLDKLGRQVGLTRQTISSYCLGNSRPNYKLLLRLADYFGVTTDYLLTGFDPRDKAEHQELGLSGEAVRLLKICNGESLEFINTFLSDPIFYSVLSNALHSMNFQGVNVHKFNDVVHNGINIVTYLVDQNGGDRKKASNDFINFMVYGNKDIRAFKSYFENMMLEKSGANEVIDALTEG